MPNEVTQKIKDFLISKGYELGSCDEKGNKTLACSHTCGIPSNGVLVKPNYSPIDGSHTLLVTPTSINRYVIKTPYFHHEWQIQSSRTYGTAKDLEKHLNRMLNAPVGCWA